MATSERAGLTEYVRLVHLERESRPAEAMLVDEIDRLRAQLYAEASGHQCEHAAAAACLNDDEPQTWALRLAENRG